MNNSFMYVSLAVLAVLIVIGLIAIIIMKKAKASENVVSVTIISTLFCGLLVSGILVYLVSLGMMKDYIAIKRYADPRYFFNEDPEQMITVKEYSSSECTGFEVYLKNDKEMAADIETDAYLPFSAREYKIEWDNNTAKVHFTYTNDGDDYKSKYIIIDVEAGTVSESMDSDKDLRPEKDIPEKEQSEAA